MGIDFQIARMLCEAHERGCSFNETATIGHLSLFLRSGEVRLLRRAYRNANKPDADPVGRYKFGDYSDGFLRDFLGVSTLAIIDISAYQGANVIHDLNEPIAETLHGRFDVVIESGSLEHIFNFPVAISSLMKMVKTGGIIFLGSPANNLCGHGFYQFSPELIFRVFSRENGFDLHKVILYQSRYPSTELIATGRAYEVVDPVTVHSRVGLLSKRPVVMIAEAKKIEQVALFTEFPLQSDYVELWKHSEAKRRHVQIGDFSSESLKLRGITKARELLRRLPLWLRARAIGFHEKRTYSFSNRRFYKRL